MAGQSLPKPGAGAAAGGRSLALTALVGVATLVLAGGLGVILGRALADDGTSGDPTVQTELSLAATGPIGVERVVAAQEPVPVLRPTAVSSDDDLGEAILAGDFGPSEPFDANTASAPVEAAGFDAIGPDGTTSGSAGAAGTSATDGSPSETDAADPATSVESGSAVESDAPDDAPVATEPAVTSDTTDDAVPGSGSGDGSDGASVDSDSEPDPDADDASPDAPGEPATVEQVDGVEVELSLPIGPATPGGFLFDPDLPILDLLPPIFFDPCAGVEPGLPVPEGCPPGVGATLFTLDLPGPFVDVVRGVAPAAPGGPAVEGCPSSGASLVLHTVLSRTPLVQFDVRYRTYGTETWQTNPFVVAEELSGGVTTRWAAMNANWLSMFDAGEIEPGWDVLPYCIRLRHDQGDPQEIELTGTDAFGRPVASGIIRIVPENSQLRPPAEVRVDITRSAVEIDRWLRPFEQSHLSSLELSPTTSPEDVSCADARRYEPARAFRWPIGDLPGPAGVYDDEISHVDRSRTNVTPGSRTLICGIGVGPLLVEMPTQRYPTVVVQGVRNIADGNDLPWLTISLGDPDRCGALSLLTGLDDGASTNIETDPPTRWDCRDGGFPVQLDGRGTVHVSVRDDSDRLVGSAAVPVEVQSCVGLWLLPDGSSTDCPPPRPRQWFEVPVWLDGPCTWTPGCGDPDGIVVVRTEDRDVRGTGVGSAQQVEVGEPVLPEVIQLSDFGYRIIDAETATVGVQVEFNSDRPITGEMRLVVDGRVDPECALPESITDFETLSGTNRYRATVPGICRGDFVGFDFEIAEPGGDVQYLRPPAGFFAPRLVLEFDARSILDPDDVTDEGAVIRQETIAFLEQSRTMRFVYGRGECERLHDRFSRFQNPVRVFWDGRNDKTLAYRLAYTGRGDPCTGATSPTGFVEFMAVLTAAELESGGTFEVRSDDGRIPVLLEIDVTRR